ncbi:MAG: conjugative transfer ATPase, partial [Methylococcales bacterium]|nr:conjugative transfer ATPase [Methylococcales bacterium]
EDTVLAMTITIKAQDEMRNHLGLVQRGSVGDYPEARLAAIDAEKAVMEIAKGNKLYPVQTAFFVRGDDEPDLHRKINELSSLLLSNSIQPIMEKDDVIALDSYIRNLPMGYIPEHDKRDARRSRLIFSKHIANIAPVYGRSTGTGHPGLLFFNRGAEPLVFDPLNFHDRKKNAHALIIGPTGAGKSATLVYLILQMLAIYRPRIFIIEAGNSFGLLGQYLKSKDVTVNQVTMAPNADVSLPPFSEALKLLDEYQKKGETLEILDDDDLNASIVDEEIDLEDESRDLLGEMEIAARIMITGGEPREDDRMTRADRLMIRNAILLAAKTVIEDDRDQVLTEDVANALRHLPDLMEKRQERAIEMADGLSLFCDGLAGHFFNRTGTRWPDVDVTITDMGILAREGYEDQLTVAYIGLMNHIHDLVEQHQNDDRPTIVITDEGHIITTNPLLAPYVIKIVKMWRKLGAWFWIATQNLEDFPDASKKMLNMLEWWMCLVMPKEEVEQIA